MIIAIDPGKSGGFAFGTDLSAPEVCNMPDTLGDLAALLRQFPSGGVVYLEKVGGYAGGRGAPGSAMFNFGKGVGHLEAITYMQGLEMRQVAPQKWQKALSLGNSNGMSKTEWKNKLKERAQQLYPKCTVTLATADALLIYHAAHRGLI
jgi:hypothetical protein